MPLMIRMVYLLKIFQARGLMIKIAKSVGVIKVWSAPVKNLRLTKEETYWDWIRSWMSPGGVSHV